MKKLNDEELYMIKGGSSLLTGTFINAVTRLFGTLYEIGRAIGSSISRYYSGNYCV